ncbi:MAG: DUF5131 family protein [Oscillospiraceae bacterium]|nr:DUF5131 family protein [Oscillospiraceae bacterium]
MIWNPWHGCKKTSTGCLNCYMYRRDAQFGKDSSIVEKTSSFALPVSKRRDGSFRLSGGVVYTCMTSDFFIDEADEWRKDAWRMIRERADLDFYIITKRIDRFEVSLPDDWGDGYENVTICSTCEDQKTADKRLPILLSLPIRHRQIIHEPMLSEIYEEEHLASGLIEKVVCGGESGYNGRLCRYGWILSVREQCIRHNVAFYFKQTGTHFEKDGRVYTIERKNQLSQAKRAGINTQG